MKAVRAKGVSSDTPTGGVTDREPDVGGALVVKVTSDSPATTTTKWGVGQLGGGRREASVILVMMLGVSSVVMLVVQVIMMSPPFFLPTLAADAVSRSV